jgi:hypothetical protein
MLKLCSGYSADGTASPTAEVAAMVTAPANSGCSISQ